LVIKIKDFFAGIKAKESSEEYYIGIIDILTEYTYFSFAKSKKIEREKRWNIL